MLTSFRKVRPLLASVQLMLLEWQGNHQLLRMMRGCGIVGVKTANTSSSHCVVGDLLLETRVRIGGGFSSERGVASA